MDTRTEPQPAESLREQLRRAEANLKAATAHFRALRRAAFAGRYDPDEFDQAVLACRAAEADLIAARHTAATTPAAGQTPRPRSRPRRSDQAAPAPQPPQAPPAAQPGPAEPPGEAGRPGGDGRPDDGARTPDPLARLRFARWLVQTGRLSEELAA
jgi:hypothetical protein